MNKVLLVYDDNVDIRVAYETINEILTYTGKATAKVINEFQYRDLPKSEIDKYNHIHKLYKSDNRYVVEKIK